MKHRRPHYVLRTLLPLGLASLSLSLISLPTAASATTKISYVALGDSYSSGEGLAAQASGYITNLGYNTGKDGCHRASDAYPELVKKSFGGNLGSFTFVACSGDYTGAKYTGAAKAAMDSFDTGGSLVTGRDQEAPQISKAVLGSATDISLTIGGNDAGFANVAKACLSMMLKAGPVKNVTALTFLGNCSAELANSSSVIGDGTAATPLSVALIATYEAVLKDAPGARLAVLTYPQLLTSKQIPASNFCPLTGGVLLAPLGATAYLGFNSKVQRDINAMEAKANQDIMSAVASVASLPKYQGHIRLVKVTGATIPQPCNTKTLSKSEINGIDFAPGDGIAQIYDCRLGLKKGTTCANFISNKSLHPTKAGHQRMAMALEAAFKASWGSTAQVLASTIVSSDGSYCAVTSSGGAVCWGRGEYGQLGDGNLNADSAVPKAVEGVDGVGLLSGVTSIQPVPTGYCALLTNEDVACWGQVALRGQPYPQLVASSSGIGPLTGATSIVGTYREVSLCALLTTGGVDCWGADTEGELGSGEISSLNHGWQPVVGLNGTGTLGGVAALSSDGLSYCAVLTSGGVDCWGNTVGGITDVPVPVGNVGGLGILNGVKSLSSNGSSYCAVLTSGGVDCWGGDNYGELGDGGAVSGNLSTMPVPVVSVGASSYLANVISVVGDTDGYCALLSSGGVDCWGLWTQLGDGVIPTNSNLGSDVPVTVSGVGGIGDLGNVLSLQGGGSSVCAISTSKQVACWGLDTDLGAGTAVANQNSSGVAVTPLIVEGINGNGQLANVLTMASDTDGYCAVSAPDNIACWGNGQLGQLGNGVLYGSPSGGSDVPVEVKAVAG